MTKLLTIQFKVGRIAILSALFAALSFSGFGQTIAPGLVISQVYTAGGLNNALFQHDFIELFNNSASAINASSYTVQYAAAAGTTWTKFNIPSNTTIPPYGYFLIRAGSSGASGALFQFDDDVSTNLATAAGKIALVQGNATLSGQQDTPSRNASVVDFVGYGTTANAFEGTGPTPVPSIINSVARQGGGLVDTDDNADDFQTQTPDPRSSAIVTFYTKATGVLNQLATFGKNANGSGAAPSSFSAPNQLFFVSGTARTISADWTVSGPQSKAVLQPNASFIVPATAKYSGTLDLGSAATLVQSNPTPEVLKLDVVSATSTVEFNQTATFTVPALGAPGYGNLTLRNATKQFDDTTTVVRGNLLVGGAGLTTTLAGNTTLTSIVSLGGNFTLAGTVTFNPLTANDRFSLVATSLGAGAPQVLNGGGNVIKLFRLSTATNQRGVTLADNNNLELGSGSGGGYNLGNNSVLTLGKNTTLSFPVGATATVGGNGTLAVDPTTNLSFTKTNTGAVGTLRLTPSSSQLNNLTLNTTSSTSILTLGSDLTVSGTLTVNNGVLAVGSTTTGSVLNINGPLVTTSTGFIRGNTTGDLRIGGSGALGLLYVNGGNNAPFRNFTLNRPGATLTTVNTMTVNNAFLVENGIFNIGGGANLILNGTVSAIGNGQLSGVSTSGLVIGPSTTSSPVGSISFSSTAGVLGTLTLNRIGQTLTVVGSPLDVTTTNLSAGTLALGNDVALTIRGVLTVPDQLIAMFAGTPTSSLNFVGSGAIGSLAFAPGQNTLLSLTMNRPLSTTNPNSGPPTVQLTTDLRVNSLTLTNGRIFVQNAHKLEVLPGGSLTGGGDNSYSNTLTLPAVTNTATPSIQVSFPLGVNMQYRPLVFTVTDAVPGTASYTARQVEAPSPQRTLPPTLLRVSQIRYYNVVRENSNTGSGITSSVLDKAVIQLSYNVSDRVTTGNASLLRVAMADPADDSRWKDIGSTGGLGTTVTSQSFPAGPLGDFTLATDITTSPNVNPLPVELVRFTATRQAGGVQLAWGTATEKNSDYFDVQRSLDGQTFVPVARMAANGTSSQPHNYAALDAKAPASRLYYRLRQVDLDGTVAFSPVVSVSGTGAPLELALYPNPTTDRITIAVPAASCRTYRVLNTLGQVVDHGDAATADPVVAVHRLPAGTYILELRTAAGRQMRRFVKND
ncbi:lamin tail domain-containing protein [Hymenobacter arizonensis]|uniref:Por secretion system C-terminal sorting domain-containing protein n=1 Tax=Hymenobacter arizonensis TaxID=1227077 RepID=A0A1I5VAX9_HYMAR|nr:lamin tail domain-containing protein [Hymenobacter arizonensis]SFQ04497.1 Por secretion system C-terminal sorting domain-containing protein [Hymenobacter arizonensis]